MLGPLSVFADTGLSQVAELLRSADVSLTALDCCIRNGEDWPAFTAGNIRGGSYMQAPPSTPRELQWLGIDMVWNATNHSSDFGEDGILTTNRYLDAAGMPHAGTGQSLSHASQPAYMDTAKGRVALIGGYEWGPQGRGDLPFPIPQGVMAADQGPFFESRPGVNLVRFEAVHHVDRATLDALRRASDELGWEPQKRLRSRGGGRSYPIVGERVVGGEVDTETEFHFMGTKFVLDDKFGYQTMPHQADIDRNVKWIREARRQADIVVAGYHIHEGLGPDYIASHTRILAHAAIDAGADIFARHGGARGAIEIYKGKAIFYGVPDLVVQTVRVNAIPLETMKLWGLGYEDSALDWLERRERLEAEAWAEIGGRRKGRARHHLAIYMPIFDRDKQLKEVRVIPTRFTSGDRADPGSGSRAQFGLPRLADPASPQARETLEAIAERCAEVGTDLDIRDGIGIVHVL